MKNYEVTITAFATVLVVAAESEEKALEYATNDIRMGDLELDEASIKREVPDDDLKDARLNVDVISEE